MLYLQSKRQSVLPRSINDLIFALLSANKVRNYVFLLLKSHIVLSHLTFPCLISLNEYGLFVFMNIYALQKLQNAHVNVNFLLLIK